MYRLTSVKGTSQGNVSRLQPGEEQPPPSCQLAMMVRSCATRSMASTASPAVREAPCGYHQRCSTIGLRDGADVRMKVANIYERSGYLGLTCQRPTNYGAIQGSCWYTERKDVRFAASGARARISQLRGALWLVDVKVPTKLSKKSWTFSGAAR